MPEVSPSGGAGREHARRDDDQRTGGAGLALSLSGGNALGAYQAGGYQALHERGLEPDWVAGGSAGAINGAIICGNPRERRIEQLQSLWAPASTGSAPPSRMEEARRTGAAAWTLAAGRPSLFVPRNLFGPWWNPLANPEPSSLYDATPMRATLERLIDFDLLNRGVPRFSATAVDIETGDDVVFDTTSHRIAADHLRASSALLPAFSPVEIDRRLLGDAGISANLPLDGVLSEARDRPLLVIAMDLLPLRAPRPDTLGGATTRMQDLLFATQSRRAIAAWQALFDERTRHGAMASVTLLHIAYSDQAREISGKAFDFSAESAAARWRAGHIDLGNALDDLASGRISTGRPGLSVWAMPDEGERLEEVRWSLSPTPG
jgi:NTE family protein